MVEGIQGAGQAPKQQEPVQDVKIGGVAARIQGQVKADVRNTGGIDNVTVRVRLVGKWYQGSASLDSIASKIFKALGGVLGGHDSNDVSVGWKRLRNGEYEITLPGKNTPGALAALQQGLGKSVTVSGQK